MSLTTLPIEVLETLLLYVDKKDLFNVWSVLGLGGSESFWRKVCRREGYKTIAGEKESWKAVFQRNINWTTQNFVKHKYNFPKYDQGKLNHLLFYSVHVKKDFLHRKNLIKLVQDKWVVFNIDSTPKLVQSIDNIHCLQVNGSKLATHYSDSVTIYFSENGKYYELTTLNIKLFCNNSSHCCLSEEFFAFFDNNMTTVKLVSFRDLKEFSFSVSSKKGIALSIHLSDIQLFVLLLESSQFLLRRFDLGSKNQLEDLILFQGTVLIGIPNLKIGTQLIISWSSLLEQRGITPVKVWSSNGKFLKSLSVDSLISSGTSFRTFDQILWMIIEDNYVIFSNSSTSINVWTSLKPDVCQEIFKSETYYLGQSVISSSLLVLCYSYCFKVVNFQNATYLYEVIFENCLLNDLPKFMLVSVYANEYFCAVLNARAEHELSDTSLTLASTSKNQEKESQSSPILAMYIYDFRGESVESSGS